MTDTATTFLVVSAAVAAVAVYLPRRNRRTQ